MTATRLVQPVEPHRTAGQCLVPRCWRRRRYRCGSMSVPSSRDRTCGVLPHSAGPSEFPEQHEQHERCRTAPVRRSELPRHRCARGRAKRTSRASRPRPFGRQNEARSSRRRGLRTATLLLFAPLRFLRSSQPFSAIMIVGAFVLVEVTAGMTEASMTPVPRAHARGTRRRRRHRVATHHAGATSVIAGAAVAPGIIEQFIVALEMRARQRSLLGRIFSAPARRRAGARTASRQR